ncbi:MAG: ZIP family metal transporter [Clostridia bacterium]|nr:ZIP family metal transporter [Clostridia bacterium]
MTDKVLIMVLSLVAGVAGTAIGGIIGALLSNKSSKFMSRVLAFAGGIMVGVVCFEMIPEAIEMTAVNNQNWSSVLITLSAVIAGIIAIYSLNKVLDVLENKRAVHKDLQNLHHQTAILQVEEDKENCENGFISNSQNKTKNSLFKAGLVMLLAIALHNFPEGMAIGSSGVASTTTGIIVALVIAVHNIPEGMCIAAPLASGGVGKVKTVLLTALAGGATFIGAIIGILIGGISPIATGVCMGLAGGAMLYVTFGEIIPQVILMEEGRIPSVSTLSGILCALVIVYIF